jgi:phosphoserine phosphatase
MVHKGSDSALAAWKDGAARKAIQEFVARAVRRGSAGFIRPEDRIAVFDNDGTLWCEKPMPIELGFILQRLSAMARGNPELRDRQPWKAARENDHAWLAGAITKHYQGDDGDLKLFGAGALEAFRGWAVEDYEAAADVFLHNSVHPQLGRPLVNCAYVPMIQLMRYLEANGFTTYIASGGDRDFMRAFTSEIYSVPPERVIGSAHALKYQESEHGGSVVYRAAPDVFDDGPAKPVRIWSRIGRRPAMAAGNSNGDIPMLQYAGGGARPALRLLVLHDDKDREFAYTAGAEDSLAHARSEGWTIVSIRNDWETVFANAPAVGRAA